VEAETYSAMRCGDEFCCDSAGLVLKMFLQGAFLWSENRAKPHRVNIGIPYYFHPHRVSATSCRTVVIELVFPVVAQNHLFALRFGLAVGYGGRGSPCGQADGKPFCGAL
jgi:hypothetical protein